MNCKVSIELPAGVEPLPNAGFKLVEVGGHAEVLRQPRHLFVLFALASVPAKAEVTRQVPDLGLLRPDLKNMLSQKDRLLHKYCHYPILTRPTGHEAPALLKHQSSLTTDDD